jgi:hypothetical protein
VIPAITLDKSGTLVLGPCGSVSVTGSIQIYNAAGLAAFEWRGCEGGYANGGTNFQWNGGTTDPLFRVRGVAYSRFGNFKITANLATPLKAGIQFETTGALATSRVVESVYMQGTDGGIVDGILWCTGSFIAFESWSWCNSPGGSGGDGNNDDDRIQDVTVTNYSQSAFHIAHTQSTQHLFVHSFMNSDTFAPYGLYDQGGGGFTWIGGSGGNNTTSDFRVLGAVPYVNIYGFDTEGSARLYDDGGSVFQSVPVTIIGGRFAANAVNADGKVVLYSGYGPFNIQGMTFIAGSIPLTIDMSPNAQGFGTAIGNIFTHVAAVTGNNPFTCAGTATKSDECWNRIGNMTAPISIPNASITWAAGTATVTTVNPHGWPTGTYIGTIQGTTPSGYDVFGPTFTVTGASTFTYPLAGNPGTSPATIPGVSSLIGNFPVSNSIKANPFPVSGFDTFLTVNVLNSRFPCTVSTQGQAYWVTNQGNTAAWHDVITDGGGGGVGQWVYCGAGNVYRQQ